MAFGKLPIVLQQKVTQRDLDLIGSKEPSGTGVLSVPKSEVLLTCADQVCHLVLSGGLPHAEESVSIKLFGLIVILRILHVGTRH